MIGPQQDTTATVQGATHPTLPLTAELTKPAVPAGVFMSPDEVTQMHAARAGTTTSAQLGAQYSARGKHLPEWNYHRDEKAMLTLRRSRLQCQWQHAQSVQAAASLVTCARWATPFLTMFPDEQYVSMKTDRAR